MSRVDPLNRQTTPSALAQSQKQQQQQVSQNATTNLNTPQTGATGTLVHTQLQHDPASTAQPTKKQIENRLDSQLANQLPTTPAPSALQKDAASKATNSSPAPDSGLGTQAAAHSWSPDKAMADNLAKDLSTQQAPQLPEPADTHAGATQNGLDPRLQAEVNLARGRGTDAQGNQQGQNEQGLNPQDVGSNSLGQQLSQPAETTPEAPVASAAEASLARGQTDDQQATQRINQQIDQLLGQNSSSNSNLTQQLAQSTQTTPNAPAATAQQLAQSTQTTPDAPVAAAQQAAQPVETTPEAPVAAAQQAAQPAETTPEAPVATAQQLAQLAEAASEAPAQQLAQPPETTPEAPVAAAYEAGLEANQAPVNEPPANQQIQQSDVALKSQDLGDSSPAQQLSQPAEATPEAPVATAAQANPSDNQHRGETRSTQAQPQAQAAATNAAAAATGKDAKPALDPQHPSALLLADSKLGAARLAALLTPAVLQQDEGKPVHGKHATAMMSNVPDAEAAQEAEEARAPGAAGPHAGLPEEAHAPATGLARANSAAEAAALLGAERAAMLLQALSAAGQPLVAVVWTDIFRMQQARLDQLTANRGVDEDGEMAPADSEEASRRHRRIQGVDLSGTHGRGTAPGWEELQEADPLAEVDVWFRAALLATALQRPQIVTRMFRAATQDETQKVRFFRRDKAARFLEQWHALSDGQVPVSALPDLPREAAPVLAMAGRNAPPRGAQAREQLHTWMEAAEQAYAGLLKDTNMVSPGRGARRGEQALEMIHGRDALSVPVSLVLHEAASMWGHIIRTNPPYDEPVVATTTATAIDGLLPDHAYAVLGTFRRGPQWMVALCNPAGSDGYSDACGIFGLPFETLLKNASELTMLRKSRG